MRMNVPSGLQGTWVRNFCLGCGLFGHIFEKRNIKLHAKSDEWVPRYINIPFVDVFSHDAEMVRSSEWWPLSKLILSLAQKDNLFRAGMTFPGLHATTQPWTGAPGATTGRGLPSVAIGCHAGSCSFWVMIPLYQINMLCFFGDFQWSNSFPKLDESQLLYVNRSICCAS